MSYYQDRRSPRTQGRPAVSPNMHYDSSQAPAVSVLDKPTKGSLCIKVEPDIMAYILYCYYDEFARIQQTYQVAITWSGKDNNVLLCATSHTDPSQLHLATQQFLFFYHHIASILVAAPLSSHVTNITLHQYHKATYEVKKLHSKAMIKEVKTTGRIALYCPGNDVKDAKKTFLLALQREDSPQSFSPTGMRMTNGETFIQPGRPPKPPQNSDKRRSSLRKTTSDSNQSKSFVHFNVYQEAPIKSASTFSQPNYPDFNSIELNGDYQDEGIGISFDKTDATMKHRLPEETASSNGSSGYASNTGTISRHQLPPYNATMPHRSRSDGYYENKHSILPPIAQPNSIHFARPPGSVRNHDSPSIRSESPDYSSFYFDDIQHSEAVSPPLGEKRPNTQGSVTDTMSGSYPSYSNGLGKPYIAQVHPFHGKSMSDVQTRTLTKPKKPNYGELSARQNGQRPGLPNKPSFIPKMESPFRFLQNHKKYFEVTTPTGVIIEVHEGDVTDAGCDAIVNVTNSQLHVNGELAWAVAKHGLFEIPKLTKLHVAMHGPMMESKVMVTPSVGLPSTHIIHAVAPKWNGNDQKKSRKLLYSVYKNIFNMANVELKSTSIAMPVIGLGNAGKSEESYPFHIAMEVMYQALIAFLKLGSTTLRHIRYIDSDPDHVNLIVTSIKPKIENVTYDSRFVNQHQLQRNAAAMDSVSSMHSDDSSNMFRFGSPPFTSSSAHMFQSPYNNNKTLPNLKGRQKSTKKR